MIRGSGRNCSCGKGFGKGLTLHALRWPILFVDKKGTIHRQVLILISGSLMWLILGASKADFKGRNSESKLLTGQRSQCRKFLFRMKGNRGRTLRKQEGRLLFLLKEINPFPVRYAVPFLPCWMNSAYLFTNLWWDKSKILDLPALLHQLGQSYRRKDKTRAALNRE